jgi:hypothetical protein
LIRDLIGRVARIGFVGQSGEEKLPDTEGKLPSDVLPGRALDYKPLRNNDLR